MVTASYPIGTLGVKWGKAEKAQWLAKQSVKRSYHEEVVRRLGKVSNEFTVSSYGELSYLDKFYPVLEVRNRVWLPHAPTVLITGGVHGYETSGVLGAVRFAVKHASAYLGQINMVIAPCVSPWAFETINRWNPDAIDPNRSFIEKSPAQESALLMAMLSELPATPIMHIDLHETTNTDNSEFRPALAARDGVVNHNWNIPDGFYLVGDTKKPAADFQHAIIQAVKAVTHIAPADKDGKIIGEVLAQEGVVNYDTVALGLCAGSSGAQWVTTTEVYPDSPKTNAEKCILAQVEAIKAAIDFVLDNTEVAQ